MSDTLEVDDYLVISLPEIDVYIDEENLVDDFLNVESFLQQVIWDTINIEEISYRRNTRL